MSEGDKRPRESVKEWFRHADQNLAVAERELAYPEAGYHTICFLCQSAAVSFCPSQDGLQENETIFEEGIIRSATF